MSRSYRHNPICGMTCARSDKPGKVVANRSLRHRAAIQLRTCIEFDNFATLVRNEVSSPWDFPKDGKQRFSKDSSYYAKLLRK